MRYEVDSPATGMHTDFSSKDKGILMGFSNLKGSVL